MRPCQLGATLALIVLVGIPAAAQSTRQTPPNPFLGSVSKGAATAEPLALSVKDAVQRALENNLGLLLQEESETSARGARWRALSELLPNVSGSLASRRQVINLEAYGFPPPPGESPLVGPFNVLDARLSLSQSVLDLQAIGLNHAAGLNAEAAKSGAAATRESVVVTCAALYLRAAADTRRIEAIKEEVAAAQSLYEHAVHLKETGVVAGIEVPQEGVERAHLAAVLLAEKAGRKVAVNR